MKYLGRLVTHGVLLPRNLELHVMARKVFCLCTSLDLPNSIRLQQLPV